MVSERDITDIKTLYYIHRFVPASIARLYGVSKQTISNIIEREGRNITIISDSECLLCGLPDVLTFYIDGDQKNKRPQNIIMLCEADKRRLQHLQMKNKRLTEQF